MTIKGKKGDTIVKEDEDYKKLLKEKFRGLKSAFKAGGSVTPANSSSLNDGASAVVLASSGAVEKEGLKPIAKILGRSHFPSDGRRDVQSTVADTQATLMPLVHLSTSPPHPLSLSPRRLRPLV